MFMVVPTDYFSIIIYGFPVALFDCNDACQVVLNILHRKYLIQCYVKMFWLVDSV